LERELGRSSVVPCSCSFFFVQVHQALKPSHIPFLPPLQCTYTNVYMQNNLGKVIECVPPPPLVFGWGFSLITPMFNDSVCVICCLSMHVCVFVYGRDLIHGFPFIMCINYFLPSPIPFCSVLTPCQYTCQYVQYYNISFYTVAHYV